MGAFCAIQKPQVLSCQQSSLSELFQIESLKIKTNEITVVLRWTPGSLFPSADVGGLRISVWA